MMKISACGIRVLAGLVTLAAIPAAFSQRTQTADMTEKVWRQVAELQSFTVFDSIQVQARHSRITLTGWVTAPELKTAAEKASWSVDGVTNVRNNLIVISQGPNVRKRRARAYAKIYGHPDLKEYNPHPDRAPDAEAAEPNMDFVNNPPRGPHPIQIVVQKGRITLEGVVNDVGDRAVASEQAMKTGVTNVANNLQALLYVPMTKVK